MLAKFKFNKTYPRVNKLATTGVTFPSTGKSYLNLVHIYVPLFPHYDVSRPLMVLKTFEKLHLNFCELESRLGYTGNIPKGNLVLLALEESKSLIYQQFLNFVFTE